MLTDAIKQRIKPPEVKIGGDLKLTSYAPDGVQEIKDALEIASKAGVKVRYMGAGTYHMEVIAEDYKEAEKTLASAIDPILEHAKEKDMAAEWARKED